MFNILKISSYAAHVPASSGCILIHEATSRAHDTTCMKKRAEPSIGGKLQHRAGSCLRNQVFWMGFPTSLQNWLHCTAGYAARAAPLQATRARPRAARNQAAGPQPALLTARPPAPLPAQLQSELPAERAPQRGDGASATPPLGDTTGQ